LEENGCNAQWRREQQFSDYTPERQWRSTYSIPSNSSTEYNRKNYYFPSQSICSRHLLHPKQHALQHRHIFDNPDKTASHAFRNKDHPLTQLRIQQHAPFSTLPATTTTSASS
jgi:hypothetical protein